MNGPTLKVAIIGAGVMGQQHARSWTHVPYATVTTICDFNLDAATKLATEFHAVATTSIDSVLASDVDVVSVCIPTCFHTDTAVKVLESGKHLLLEKPMALTVEDCHTIEAAAEASGKLLTIGQVVRFFPEYENAKRAVDAGAVGKPAVVRCRRGGIFPLWGTWFHDVNKSGGAIFDVGIHEIDWLLWLFGPVERVYARSLTDSLGEDSKQDFALVTLRHKSGVISHMEACWADPVVSYNAFEIAGDGGLLTHDSRNNATLFISTAEKQEAMSPLADADEPYNKQIAAFAKSIVEGTPLAVTGADGRAAIAVAAAALESSRTRKVVTL